MTSNFDITLTLIIDSINYRHYDVNNVFTYNYVGRVLLKYNF